MRFPFLLLSLALLSVSQLVSADNATSIIGNWTRPTTVTDVSEYCCIPSSIEIKNSGTNLLAIYRYPALLSKDYNPKCFKLFFSLDSGNMTLYPLKGSPNTYYSIAGLLGNVPYGYQLTADSDLSVFIGSVDPADACDFTMKTKNAPPMDFSWAYLLIIVCIIFLALVILRGSKKKKPNAQNNLALPAFNMNPSPNYGYMPPNNAYRAPNNVPVVANNVSVAPRNVAVAMTNVQGGPKVNPDEEFLEDYPKFI